MVLLASGLDRVSGDEMNEYCGIVRLHVCLICLTVLTFFVLGDMNWTYRQIRRTLCTSNEKARFIRAL